MRAPPFKEASVFPDYECDVSAEDDDRGVGFSPGDRVTHEAFGPGEVVEIHGRGPTASVGVRFEFRGVKRIRPQFLRR